MYQLIFLFSFVGQMGKKKFIDKKKSATFQLLARDTSDPVYYEDPENDRVFVRVDNNPVAISGLNDDHEGGSDYESFSNDPNSIFADAPHDVDCGKFTGQSRALPAHVRREILELGFPDDGYNYLIHLREIRNTGGGSAYYRNPKANLHDLPHDVKVKIAGFYFGAKNCLFQEEFFLVFVYFNAIFVVFLF